jgi:hypothetical protein
MGTSIDPPFVAVPCLPPSLTASYKNIHSEAISAEKAEVDNRKACPPLVPIPMVKLKLSFADVGWVVVTVDGATDGTSSPGRSRKFLSLDIRQFRIWSMLLRRL